MAEPRKTTLGKQLAWLVLAVVIPMLGFGLVGVVLQYRSEKADAARDAIELARDLGSVLEADLKARSAALQTLALSPSLASGDLTTFHAQLQQMMATQFPDSNITLWDADARQVMSTAKSDVAAINATQLPPPSVPMVLKNGHPAISDAYDPTGSGTVTVSIDVPVQREDGAVDYVLSMIPAPQMIAEDFETMPIRDGWTVAVADRTGTIIARSKDEKAYIGRKAGHGFFARPAKQPSAYVAEVVNRQGTPVLMTYRQSEPSGWTVVVGISHDELLRPAWHLVILTLTVGAALLILGLLQARIIARRITGPINALRLLSTAGDRRTQPAAPFATGLREVDEVGRALVQSFTQLQQSRIELARVNAGLESRVTEAVAARDAAHERLARGQKIQALGQLAGGIAHDFNNILQTMIGAATMIDRRPQDSERSRHLARLTLKAVSRGASITQRLLTFVRRGKLGAEPIDTATLLEGVGEMLAHTLGSPISVRTEVPEDTPGVFADRDQLETALVNLGINARDAMPNGGTLTLRAREERMVAGNCHPASLAPGNYVRIDVKDTGTGIEPAILARVTEPFFTTKPPGVGTGLGLSIVRGFVEQSGGAMLIESTPGSGTVVTLWLRQPAGDEATRQPSSLREPRFHSHSTGCILVVDDDDLVRQTIVAQLEDVGFTTFAASNGRDALALLDAQPEIDALVCDLAMADLNGIATIRSAHQRRPALPCFLLTGDMGEQTALSPLDSFTVLRKPLSGAALAAHIDGALAAC